MLLSFQIPTGAAPVQPRPPAKHWTTRSLTTHRSIPVVVSGFVRHKMVAVHAGHGYLARATGR